MLSLLVSDVEAGIVKKHAQRHLLALGQAAADSNNGNSSVHVGKDTALAAKTVGLVNS